MELGFAAIWRGEPYEAEYRFHKTRKFRFDYAWPLERVAVEFDGGQWEAGGGRHNRDSDREKLVEAGALGWIVLQFSNQQWKRDPCWCTGCIQRALGSRSIGGNMSQDDAGLTLEAMQRVLLLLCNERSDERSERNRRLAVTITEMEKVVAYYTVYVKEA